MPGRRRGRPRAREHCGDAALRPSAPPRVRSRRRARADDGERRLDEATRRKRLERLGAPAAAPSGGGDRRRRRRRPRGACAGRAHEHAMRSRRQLGAANCCHLTPSSPRRQRVGARAERTCSGSAPAAAIARHSQRRARERHRRASRLSAHGTPPGSSGSATTDSRSRARTRALRVASTTMNERARRFPRSFPRSRGRARAASRAELRVPTAQRQAASRARAASHIFAPSS